MGYYLNQTRKGPIERPDFASRCKALMEDGAIEIDTPKEWKEGLVCVVNNDGFSAAAYCYSENEMFVFQNVNDTRTKKWFYYEHAKVLSD